MAVQLWIGKAVQLALRTPFCQVSDNRSERHAEATAPYQVNASSTSVRYSEGIVPHCVCSKGIGGIAATENACVPDIQSQDVRGSDLPKCDIAEAICAGAEIHKTLIRPSGNATVNVQAGSAGLTL